MAAKDIFKISRKTFFNPRAWLGYDDLKANTKLIWSIIKDAITPDKPQRTETFEEAMQRLNLTESDIKEQTSTYFIYAICFVMLGLITIAASFYFLFIHHTLSGFIIGLAASSFVFSQAFRFHFWYFQLKHRKLGCTFEEWKRGKPFDEKGSSP